MGETREEPEFTDANIGELDESALKSDVDSISEDGEPVEDWQEEAFSGEVSNDEDAPDLPDIGELLRTKVHLKITFQTLLKKRLSQKNLY